jgi:hypothetical protein
MWVGCENDGDEVVIEKSLLKTNPHRHQVAKSYAQSEIPNEQYLQPI